MSPGGACTDRTHRPYWYVTDWFCNHSAFNGYRRTPSDYSTVWCAVCPAVWRTKAGYVYRLKGDTDRIVPSTSKELVIPCPHTSWTGGEGPVHFLGRWPIIWNCDNCGTAMVLPKEEWRPL